jgi:hypothetical protein
MQDETAIWLMKVKNLRANLRDRVDLRFTQMQHLLLNKDH